MKKYFLMIALAVIASACNRYNKHINVKLNTTDDSICYAMGTMTAHQLGQYIDSKNDSLYDGREELLKGFKDGVNDDNEYSKFKVIGHDLARMLKDIESSDEGFMGDSSIEINKDLFIQGLVNALINDSTIVTMGGNEAVEYLNKLLQVQQVKMQEEKRAQLEEQYADNKRAGEEFLAANKERSGVITTESGLQYEILKKGYGPKPKLGDNVRVHYHGTLIDGTVFDSSVERGEPAEFGVMGVIQGWQEVLQLMPVGSKWRVYVPQELAYGDNQTPSIQPFSALIFDIELIKILD